MKILKLTAENVKRLTAVEIDTAGEPMVVIAGANEAGKSSVLDAIEMALGGEKRIPPEPIHRGESKAKVVVDLGDIVVTRRFTATGTSLTVTNKDGTKYGSPQALLDGLVGRISFDPLAFATMKPEDQAVTLRAIAKIDTTDLELEKKEAFEERTDIKRDLAKAQAALSRLPALHKGVPATPESFDDLNAKLEAADVLEKALVNAKLAHGQQRALCERKREAALRAKTEVELAIRRLEQAEAAADQADLELSLTEADLRTAATAEAQAATRVPDTAVLRATLKTIQETNQKIADNQKRAGLLAEIKTHEQNVETLTRDINRCDTEKDGRLKTAQFPIAGLGLTDEGVTWHDIPFSQASTSVKTQVSVAIGVALNPKLKVLLVRNGNDLDDRHLAVLAEAAKAADASLWVERIAGGDGQATIVIEDGTVADRLDFPTTI